MFPWSSSKGPPKLLKLRRTPASAAGESAAEKTIRGEEEGAVQSEIERAEVSREERGADQGQVGVGRYNLAEMDADGFYRIGGGGGQDEVRANALDLDHSYSRGGYEAESEESNFGYFGRGYDGYSDGGATAGGYSDRPLSDEEVDGGGYYNDGPFGGYGDQLINDYYYADVNYTIEGYNIEPIAPADRDVLRKTPSAMSMRMVGEDLVERFLERELLGVGGEQLRLREARERSSAVPADGPSEAVADEVGDFEARYPQVEGLPSRVPPPPPPAIPPATATVPPPAIPPAAAAAAAPTTARAPPRAPTSSPPPATARVTIPAPPPAQYYPPPPTLAQNYPPSPPAYCASSPPKPKLQATKIQLSPGALPSGQSNLPVRKKEKPLKSGKTGKGKPVVPAKPEMMSKAVKLNRLKKKKSQPPSTVPATEIQTSELIPTSFDSYLDSTENWKACWPVIAAFSTKSGNPFNRVCILCHQKLPPAKFSSTFISTAVKWSCGHGEKGFICSICDEDFLLAVSLNKQQCPKKKCKGMAEVIMDVVEKKMVKNKKEFEEYRKLVQVECIVCCDWTSKSQKPITKGCEHERNTCRGCIAEMIDVAVKKGGWGELKCPESKCKQKLEFEDVRVAATAETFARYDDLLTQKMFKRQPNYTPCNRPGGVCKAGQIHEPGDAQPQMSCIACGYLSCFSCSSAWHEGQTCLQAHSLLPEDPESEDFKRKYCKRCPGAGCGLFTKKEGACHEMHCPITTCNITWCWECKLILDTALPYGQRNRRLHTAQCTAPLVVSGRTDASSRSVKKPEASDKRYRVGWGTDEGFVGTGREY